MMHVTCGRCRVLLLPVLQLEMCVYGCMVWIVRIYSPLRPGKCWLQCIGLCLLQMHGVASVTKTAAAAVINVPAATGVAETAAGQSPALMALQM